MTKQQQQELKFDADWLLLLAGHRPVPFVTKKGKQKQKIIIIENISSLEQSSSSTLHTFSSTDGWMDVTLLPGYTPQTTSP